MAFKEVSDITLSDMLPLIHSSSVNTMAFLVSNVLSVTVLLWPFKNDMEMLKNDMELLRMTWKV